MGTSIITGKSSVQHDWREESLAEIKDKQAKEDRKAREKAERVQQKIGMAALKASQQQSPLANTVNNAQQAKTSMLTTKEEAILGPNQNKVDNKQKQSPIGKNVGVGFSGSFGLGVLGGSFGFKAVRLANGNLAVLRDAGGGADTGIGINGKISAHSSDSRGSAGLGGQSLEHSTTIDPKVTPFTVGMSKSYSTGANATDYELSPNRLSIGPDKLKQPITNSVGITHTKVIGEYDVIPDPINDIFDYFLSQNRTKYQTGKNKTK